MATLLAIATIGMIICCVSLSAIYSKEDNNKKAVLWGLLAILFLCQLFFIGYLNNNGYL